MKVYIVVAESCSEEGISQIDTEVFGDREKAKEAFELYAKRGKKDAESLGYELEESENYFSAWEDGYYNMNHFSIELREVEVK